MNKTFNPKRMLVTGGAGFIGAHFIRSQLQAHPTLEIINLDCLSYASDLTRLSDIAEFSNYTFIQGNILDLMTVQSLLREHQIDTVVHFAAETHVDRSISSPQTFIKNNVEGTFTLLEAARKVWLEEMHLDSDACRFHQISTDEVYGSLSSDEEPLSESAPYRPNSPYAASKASADHWVRAYAKTYQLPCTLSLCSNNFGPKQHQEKLIPTIIKKALSNQPIPIYGDGSNIRDWLYVEDHCHAIDLILRMGQLGDSYHIGAHCERDNLSVAHIICQLLSELKPGTNYSKLITLINDRPGHDWRYALNTQKIRQTLGWRPQTGFETALEHTVLSYIAIS